MFASYNYEDIGIHRNQRLVFIRGAVRYVLPQLRQFRLVVPHKFQAHIKKDEDKEAEESIGLEVEVDVEDVELEKTDESQ